MSEIHGNMIPSAIRLDKEVMEDKLSLIKEIRQKKENKLYQLLAELLDTERKYVQDLEQMCKEYLPLTTNEWDVCQSLDRKRAKERKNLRRNGSLMNSPKKSNSLTPSLSQAFMFPFLEDDSLTDLANKAEGLKLSHSQTMISLDSNENGFMENKRTKNPIDAAKPVSRQEVRQMLGNLEDIKDYHKKVFLPKMEEAIDDASLMRNIFESEQQKLTRKYGRYCINHNRSSLIIDENIKFFSIYQFRNHFSLRVDAQLIKPIQRITRYHMFLSSLSKTCSDLGLVKASEEFSDALDLVQTATKHTNTMMWIGKMENCPVDLSSQGQLLKYDGVQSHYLKSISLKKSRKWSGSLPRQSPCYLFLFQQTLVLCKTCDDPSDPKTPKLIYCQHININLLRVRDVIEDDPNSFEIHKLEHIKMGITVMDRNETTSKGDLKSGLVMRLECQSEEEKDQWVKTINKEVKKLRSMAKALSSELFQSIDM